MLVSILLSIFWALCSTVLVLPWFWNSLINRKTIVGNEKYRGIDSGKKALMDFVGFQIVFFVVTFIVSFEAYKEACVPRTLFGAVFPILLVICFQMITINKGWNENTRIKNLILCIIAGSLIILTSVNTYTGYCLDIEGVETENTEAKELPITVTIGNTEQIIPNSVSIAYLFDVETAKGPMYTNSRYVYVTTEPDGIVIVDENNAKTAKFLKTDYTFLDMRSKYPFNIIRDLGIIVTDENVPYKKYAVVDKKAIVAKPVLDKYVYQNMLTGEITEQQPN